MSTTSLLKASGTFSLRKLNWLAHSVIYALWSVKHDCDISLINITICLYK